jgi:hypothetical protein
VPSEKLMSVASVCFLCRDPDGHAAGANRRNDAETGNHAFKAILGDQLYSKNA